MRATITGGASFIGSHLVDGLLKQGDEAWIIDNFSSGSRENLPHSGVHTIALDLRTLPPCELAPYFTKIDVLYHLAADHGGRGYVETHQVATSNNFAIDNNVFQAAILAGVPKIIFASSGCVYPLYMQGDTDFEEYLKEEHLAGDQGYTAYDPDGLYGLAKLAGELTLQRMWLENQIESVSCRFFTVYGPRAKENHAIISFIARAFIRQDPWIVWGNGDQVRNWTYVDDIVQGLLLATKLEGCQAINLGTEEMITVTEAVARVLELANQKEKYHPRITYDLDKPVGPLCRVASNEKYRQLGGTVTPFLEGLQKTMDWYYTVKNRIEVDRNLERLLIERK
jgi:nucleoside-diphosphate-sugar epimerase